MYPHPLAHGNFWPNNKLGNTYVPTNYIFRIASKAPAKMTLLKEEGMATFVFNNIWKNTKVTSLIIFFRISRQIWPYGIKNFLEIVRGTLGKYKSDLPKKFVCSPSNDAATLFQAESNFKPFVKPYTY